MILPFSTEIGVYIGKATKQAHGYYGSLIGSYGGRIMHFILLFILTNYFTYWRVGFESSRG